MLLTNNHFTPIVGVDLHFNSLPPFNPIHPYIGIVVDLFDYLPFVGGTTYVNGIMRGVSDTSGRIATFIHIPLFTGPFVMTPIIGHESVNFFGSANAYIEGRRISPKGHMKMTCNDIGIPLSLSPGKKFLPIPSLFAPTSFSLPIPTGPPVYIGAPYVPDWTGVLINLIASYGIGRLFRGLGSALTKLNKLLPDSNTFTRGLKKNLCRLKFEPVDLVTGRMIYEYTDFELPGPFPLRWERNYYSDSSYRGPLGVGHHHSYDVCLQTYEEEGLISVVLADGRQVAFEYLKHVNDSSFHRSERLKLTKTPDGFSLFSLDDRTTWHLAPVNGTHRIFRPNRLENEQGHSISFVHEGHQLVEMVDSSGRRLEFTHDDEGRIVSIHFGKDILVRYTYDKEGNLASVHDALDQPTLMEYDAQHRMVRKTDRNGIAFIWKYDKAGRCIFTSGEDGTLSGSIAYFDGYNEITNSRGAVETLFYNSDLLVTQEQDALGHSKFFEYTPFMEPYREIDEEGNLTGFTYDNFGNLESITYPDGTSERFMYDKEHRLIISVDANGGKSLRNYDDSGRLISTTAPDNSSLYLEYNDENLIHKITGENGQVTTLFYDTQHNVVKMELPGGGVTEWMYDAYGKVTGIKNPLGGTQRFSYDVLGRVTTILRDDNNRVKLRYNAYDEVTEARDNHHHVRFEYTPLGSLKSRTENGTTVTFDYNKEEQLKAIYNEKDEVYSFTWDQRGHIVEESGFDGLTRSYQRDRAGKIYRVNRPGGRYTEYEYDALGRMTRAEHNDGTWEIFSYDRNGNLEEARNQDSVVLFKRDAFGRVNREVQGAAHPGLDHEVTSKYDRAGNRIHLASSLGADIQFSHNTLGHVTGINAQNQNCEGQWEAKIQRNLLGLEIERQVSGGIVSRWEYDEAGRPLSQKVHVRSHTTRHRRYQWNVNDRLHGMINELTGGKTTYHHDAFGNLAWAKYEDGAYDYKLPDEVGNLYKTKDRRDRKYGPGGQLLQDDQWRYSYDEEGNLVSKTGKGGTWNYEWQGNGMLKKAISPGRTETEFTYDALGRRTAKIHQGKITRFVWDGNVPLHEWQYELKDKSEPVVDDIGRLHYESKEPVDQQSLITWVFENGSFAPSAKIEGERRYSIVSDYLGTPVEAYDEAGERIWAGELDVYGDLRKLQGKRSLIPFRYLGQYEDEETGLCYNRFRYYNPSSGQYISQDPIGLKGGISLYSYVWDTNSVVDPAGLAPSFADLKAMAQNTLDFSTTKDGAVFWSTPRMVDAQNWAADHGKTTLEQTKGGQYLDDLDLFNPSSGLTKKQAAEVWDIASKRFADGASGNVNVFSTGAKIEGPHGKRTWWRIEKPALMENPKVTSITRRRMDGSKAKTGHVVKCT